MKRVVLLFVITGLAMCLSSQVAEAQRSGSMQAIARVVDTRGSWDGLQSARDVAIRVAAGPQSNATVVTTLSQVTVTVGAPSEATLDRPRIASITINYLRN